MKMIDVSNRSFIKKLNKFFVFLYRLNLRNFKLSLILQFIILLIFVQQIPKLPIILNLNDLVDNSINSVQRLMTTKEEFVVSNNLTIFFYKENHDFNKNELTEIDKWIRSIDLNAENILNITSPFSIMTAQYLNGKLLYPNLVTESRNYSFDKLRLTSWSKYLLAKDSNHFSAEISFRDEKPGSSKFGSFDPNRSFRILDSLDNFLSSNNLSSIQYHINGPVAYHNYSFKGVKQAQKLHGLFFLIIIIVFYLLWKRFLPSLLYLILLLMTGIYCYGAMSLLGYPLEIASSTILLLVGIASLEDYIFIIKDLDNQKDFSLTFENYITPSFFTSLTTMLGFGSLTLTSIQVLERLGTIALIGAFIEWMATFFLLPLLFKIFKFNFKQGIQSSFFSNISNRMLNFKLSNKLIPILIILFIIGLISPLLTKSTNNPYFIFPPDHDIKLSDRYIKNSRGFRGYAYIRFQDTSENEITNLSKRLESIPGVFSLKSPYSDFDEYSKEVPTNLNRLMWRNFLSSISYERTFSEKYPNNFLGVLYLKNIDIDYFANLQKEVYKVCKSKCSLSGDLEILSDFTRKISLSLYKSFYLNLLIVGLILFFLSYHHGYNLSFKIIFSALWGAVITMLLIWSLSIEVNFVTSIYIVLLIGLTGDNTIQFLFNKGNLSNSISQNIEDKASSPLIITSIMSLLCFSFVFSYFQPPRIIGPLIGIGLILSVFADTKLTHYFLKKNTHPINQE